MTIIEIYTRLKKPIIFDLQSEYFDTYNYKKQIENRNVLVGTVRNREQFSVNLHKCFYHIPYKKLIDYKDVKYVALYQSKNLFAESQDQTGIRKIAKVINSKIVKRSEIHEIPTKNGDELYVRFDLTEFRNLPTPIKVREKFDKVYLKTSLYLLDNCKYAHELYIKTCEEYILYNGINDLLDDTYDGFTFKNIYARKYFKNIIVKYNGKSKRIPIKQLKRFKRETFESILRFINDKKPHET